MKLSGKSSDVLSFKNFFLKKTWNTKSNFLPNNLLLCYATVHYPLNLVKYWDPSIHFILKCKLITDMQLMHKSFLRNIFLKNINDIDLWFEIEKMINSNLIGFADEFVVRVYFNILKIFNIQIFV